MADLGGKSHVRKRRDTSKSKDTNDDVKATIDEHGANHERESADMCSSSKERKDQIQESAPSCQEMEAGSYWLTRIVFTRAIGFIYCMCNVKLI